ncbi:BZ3500_MvSof-1268-A1-R1_Chr3-1g05738 [Microbotryum saponariae]|uniref:BZ3500_MvSof-1268-A1-R1_Chr3-1g05738 protein n=1 Tax=Microbotryum saponariae TaxID=289078 RepID=A0A2X0LIN7_9BASI|nr:BZ3500_MvSof-1268-A1-R1_Chr3-1g05738 [Microbotryum saponariae]SDA04928.1 BZ3501_MvSof-1269-A2-R1_Chr3-1g05408 [Microbotryum saponariae]
MKSTSTPVIFCSHGSTMMLGEDSSAGRYWQKVGEEAMARKIEGVVFMGAHWEVNGNGFEIASNASEPVKQPVAWVSPDKYIDYNINVSPKLAERVHESLTAAGIESKLNPNVEWSESVKSPRGPYSSRNCQLTLWLGLASLVHDVFLVLTWMFPKKSPPVTLISTNAYYDPYSHVAVGAALRHLRHENILLIGTGGTVHNLYRNAWGNIILHQDNFAQTKPPEPWAIAFRNEACDALTLNSGPALRKAAMRLMRNPLYRDAHGTDDHFAPVLFCAGAAGDAEDEGTKNSATAEVWELEQMCNTQFQFGEW